MKKIRFLLSTVLVLFVYIQAIAQMPTATISGQVTLVDGATSLPGVDVVLTDELGTTVATTQTNASGEYAFADIPTGATYSLALNRADGAPLNGVSTFDAVLIARHILGVEALSSPLKMIAADANGSGTITTFDIVLIRRLILGISQQFDIPHWRFVRADLVFPNLDQVFATLNADPAQFLLGDDLTRNFIAVKIGDVNGSAVAP